jgi:hypothetical protein
VDLGEIASAAGKLSAVGATAGAAWALWQLRIRPWWRENQWAKQRSIDRAERVSAGLLYVLHIGMFTADPAGRWLTTNRRLRHIAMRSPEHLEGFGFFDCLRRGDVEIYVSAISDRREMDAVIYLSGVRCELTLRVDDQGFFGFVRRIE